MRRLQAKLGVEADGEFDANTQKALKAWQGRNGLAADGIAGADTLMAMGFHDLVLPKRGAHGDAIKILQRQLGITADGQCGPRTEKAVRDYQLKNALVADGVAGPATLAHMKLFRALEPRIMSTLPAWLGGRPRVLLSARIDRRLFVGSYRSWFTPTRGGSYPMSTHSTER